MLRRLSVLGGMTPRVWREALLIVFLVMGGLMHLVQFVTFPLLFRRATTKVERPAYTLEFEPVKTGPLYSMNSVIITTIVEDDIDWCSAPFSSRSCPWNVSTIFVFDSGSTPVRIFHRVAFMQGDRIVADYFMEEGGDQTDPKPKKQNRDHDAMEAEAAGF